MSEADRLREIHTASRFLTLGKSLLLVAILITVGIAGGIVGLRMAVRGDEVQVPSLAGQTVEEAKKTLASVQLTLEISGERYDSSVAAGQIVSQLPPAGGRSKANRPVQVIVSLGVRKNPIPDLVGSSMRSAQLMALQAGYELGNVSKISVDGQKEGVIQQYPTPQSEDVVSQKIDLLVNEPRPKRFVMPDLVGQNISVVTAFLEANQLKAQPPIYREYQNASRGQVVKQYPEPGYMVSPEDQVTLEVAR